VELETGMTSSATQQTSERSIRISIHDEDHASTVSTGRLPLPERVRALLYAVHERFAANDQGKNSDVYSALVAIPRHMFGICVAATNGAIYDSDGGIVTVAPGKGDVGAFVPPLDSMRNSIRDQQAAGFLSERLGLNVFASKPAEQSCGDSAEGFEERRDESSV
jgi:hypothetical protein